MKTIICHVQGRHKTLSYLLVAVFALAAAQPAKAEWYGFKGSATSPSYWDVQGNWSINSGGSWAKLNGGNASNVHINKDANGLNKPGFTSGWDNTITFRNSTQKLTPTLLFCAGSTSDPIKFVATSAENGLTCSADLHVRSSSYTPDPCLEIQSGTYKFTYFRLGSASGTTCTLVLDGGTLKTTSTYPRLGTGGANGVFTVKSGSFDNLDASNQNFTLGQDSGSSGTLNVEGGTVSIGGYIALNYSANSVKSTINITGGTLTVNHIYLTCAGTSGGTVTIDGGTLKANADNTDFLQAFSDATKFHVYAGANGATIDSDRHNITIGAVIENKSGEAGVVTFKGGGTITLSGTPTYSGGTTNVAGTVLSLTSAAKDAIVANPVAVEIPSTGAADGFTVFEITDGGTFTQTEVDGMVVTGTDASRYALALADNGTKVVISDTLAGEYVWNDGDSAASWRASGKWTKNGIAGDWYDSTAAFFRNAGDAATVDAAVTAASVTFGADATVGGTATLTPGTVTVSNGVSAAISAPTDGALVKDGPGTLTLAASRAATTTISDGTLVMSGSGTTLDWSGVTLGTEAGKTAILKFEDGATVASESSMGDLYICKSGSDGVTAELYKTSGDWDLGSGNMVLAQAKNSTARFHMSGGTLALHRYVRLGYNDANDSDSGEARFEISGGTVSHDKASGGGLFDIGSYGKPGFRGVLSVKANGTFNTTSDLYVGRDGAGTLDIDGGTVSVANGIVYLCYTTGNEVGEDCAIDIKNCGVFTATTIQYGNGAADAAITFDDGSLKAAADGTLIAANDKLTVTVAAGGGSIDANGKKVTIAEELAGAGGMTYKGGGIVTNSVAPAYSGKTTVEVGTTLVVPAAIAGANLAFTIPEGLATGVYKVMDVSGGGTFAADVLSTATLPTGNVRFSLENGNTEIWCAYSADASEHVWIGGASGSLNDGANWLSGSVPTSGTAIIGNPDAAALTNPEGSAFAATRIVIPSDSAAITVSGAGFSGITQIANNSTSTVEFENAVTFAENVNVTQNTGAVKFTGGATGVQLGAATDIHGTYNFTKTGDWIEIGGTTVKSDGVYKLLDGTFYKHLADFSVEAGGKVEVGGGKIARNIEARTFNAFNGEFKVNGEFYVSGGNASDFVTHYLANSGTGTLVVNRIRVVTHGTLVPNIGKTIIGGGGIIRGNGYIRVTNSGSHEFGSYGDWTFYADNLGNTTDGRAVFYKHESTTATALTFDTTDYYDSTIGRTITGEALIGAYNEASAAAFSVTVKGKGRFVFANTSEGITTGTRPTSIFSGGLTVQDSATVEVMPNAWPGKGAVVMSGTSTLLMHAGGAARTGAVAVREDASLVVSGTGAVALGGDLALADGATLGFDFSESGAAPVLNLSGRNVSFGSGKSVKVKVSGTRACAGTYVLTSGGNFTGANVTLAEDAPKWVRRVSVNGDGNIELSSATGLCIIIR